MFGTRKNIAVQVCCGHFPLCSTFSKNSATSWDPSHPSPVLAFYNLEAFSRSHSFSLGKATSNFFNSSSSQGLSSIFCTLSPHCHCFTHSCLFASHRSISLASSSSFSQILVPRSPCCGLRDFMQKSCTSLHTRNHLRHLLLLLFFLSSFSSHPLVFLLILFSFLLMHFLHLFLLFLFFHSLQPLIPFLHGIVPSWMDRRLLTHSASNSVTHHRFSASILPLELIVFVKSFKIFILCCCFSFSFS